MSDQPRNPHAPYMTVLDVLTAEIQAGKYKPGDKIPSDRELSERFGVARMTARRAVAELRERALVHTEWGRGTFVVGSAGSGSEGDDQVDA
ncbi:GntR family transcriptional regulator [Streptomyces sp. NPDC048018]|uniref:GntR family transcriptional regulator n=1 Tax=Streptomyces sp. NPDC048018 TaxID=3365499 RepID=UPI0037110DE6